MERDAFLDRACGDDESLRREVDSLLAAYERIGGFLQKQPTLIARAGRQPGPEAIAAATEQPGDRVGRYKLLEKIGEGGCGIVYLAEQEEPVRRKVALKIIKPGMDSEIPLVGVSGLTWVNLLP